MLNKPLRLVIGIASSRFGIKLTDLVVRLVTHLLQSRKMSGSHPNIHRINSRRASLRGCSTHPPNKPLMHSYINNSRKGIAMSNDNTITSMIRSVVSTTRH